MAKQAKREKNCASLVITPFFKNTHHDENNSIMMGSQVATCVHISTQKIITTVFCFLAFCITDFQVLSE